MTFLDEQENELLMVKLSVGPVTLSVFKTNEHILHFDFPQTNVPGILFEDSLQRTNQSIFQVLSIAVSLQNIVCEKATNLFILRKDLSIFMNNSGHFTTDIMERNDQNWKR